MFFSTDQEVKTLTADQIFEFKMTPLRIKASSLFLNKQFSDQTYQDLISDIQKAVPSFPEINSDQINKQIALAEEAYKTGNTQGEIDLSQPLFQFLWGLTLMRIAANPNQMAIWPQGNQSENGLINSAIWEKIKANSIMQQERRAYTLLMASKGIVKDDTRIRWGGADYPDVGYYCNFKDNLINLDVLWGLVGGLEHMRSVTMHEIGHAFGTLSFSHKTKELIDKAEDLKKKDTLTDDEEKQLRALSSEIRFRHFIFDEAENSYANGFVKNLVRKNLFHQELGESLEIIETSLFIGQTILDVRNNSLQALPKNPINEFINLKKVIRYGFHVNNGLFENTPKGWSEIGVQIDWLKGNDRKGNPIQGFDVVQDIVNVTDEIEKNQIPLTFHSSRSGIRNKIQKAFDKRSELADDLYDRYASDLVKELTQEQEKQLKEALDKQQKTFDPNQNQTKSEQDQGQNQQGQDQGQQSQNQKGQGQQGQGQGQQEEKGQSQQGQGQGQQGEKGQPQQGQGQGQQGEKGQESKQSNGTSSIPFIPKSPDDLKNSPVSDSDQGETVTVIIRSGSEKNTTNTGYDQLQMDTNSDQSDSQNEQAFQQFNQAHRDFQAPQYQQSLNEYTRIISHYLSALNKIRRLFKDMRNVYLEDNHKKVSELLPKGSLQHSLDQGSVMRRIQRSISGQPLTEIDFKHFKNSVDPTQKKAPIDICVLIDVSGSMESANTAKRAIEIACVINEAAQRDSCFNTYIALMTTPPCLIAKPGDSSKEIARKLSTFYRGGNWDGIGDQISEAVPLILKEIRGRSPKTDKEGFSHFFFITDGGHTDAEVSIPMMNKLMDNSKTTTFNWITFQDNYWSRSDNLPLQQLKNDRRGKTGIKTLREEVISNSGDIASAFTKLLMARIREMKEKPAFDTTIKKRFISDSLKKIR